eukprot:9516315-Ditylum_brightwellii.AAC.1
MKNVAQTWENLLFGSGGKFSQDKTFWYLLWWIWDQGRPTLARAVRVPADLEITIGRDTTLRRIQCLDPDQLIKQLVLLITPLGNFTAEYERRKKISVALADRARKSFISPKN